MYNKKSPSKTTISRNESYEAETLEMKIRRIVNNKEPITDGAPIIYTDRSEGVLPDYDIRTDRMEHAIDAMDKVTKTHQAKRAERIGEKAKKNMETEAKTETKKPDSGAEPIQGTNP